MFFDIDRSSSQLLTKARLDYESRNSYSLMLTVTDPTNAYDAITVMIDITNLEEVGTITLSTPQPFTDDEVVAYLDDPDGSVRDVTWQWELSQDRATWSVIDGADSGLYQPRDGDVDSYLRVTASYTDGEGPEKSAQGVSFNSVKAAVDHAPVFSHTETGLRTVAENTPPGTPIGVPFTGTSLCQMLWKLPPGGLAHQAATASSALTGSSAKIPSSNFAPSTSKPIRFLPPFSGRQRSLSLSDTLNTRYNALSRRFIRRVTFVLNLTALNTDSRGFVVRRCTQCSTGKS